MSPSDGKVKRITLKYIDRIMSLITAKLGNFKLVDQSLACLGCARLVICRGSLGRRALFDTSGFPRPAVRPTHLRPFYFRPGGTQANGKTSRPDGETENAIFVETYEHPIGLTPESLARK